MRSTSSKRIRASALCARFSASFPQSEVTVAHHPARPSSHFSGKRCVYQELIKCIRDRSKLLLFFVHEPQAHKDVALQGLIAVVLVMIFVSLLAQRLFHPR